MSRWLASISLGILALSALACCFGGLAQFDEEAARQAGVRYVEEHREEITQRSSCRSAVGALATAAVATAVSHGTTGGEVAAQIETAIGDCVTIVVTVVLVAGVWTAVGAVFYGENGEPVTLGSPPTDFVEAGSGGGDLFD